MNRRLFFFLAVVLLLALPAAAQTTEPTEIDIAKAEIIFLAGIGGFSVLALVEILKRVLKTSGWGTRIVSVIVSAGATAYYLVTAGGGFNLLKFVIFTVVVVLAANGIYLFPKQRAA
mgnify:CR=1 FL=1